MSYDYDDDGYYQNDDYYQELEDEAYLLSNEYIYGNGDPSDGIEIDGMDGDDF